MTAIYFVPTADSLIHKLDGYFINGRSVFVEGGRRAAHSYRGDYFRTFDEAAEYILSAFNRRIARETERLEYAKSKIERMRAEIECQSS